MPYICRAKSASSLKMDALKQFSLPIRGLGNSMHQFEFQVNSDFFAHYEQSIIKEGDFTVVLNLDKRTDVMEFNFSISGDFQTECDRCLSEIRLPLQGKHKILGKYSESEDENAEVIYIHPQAHELNVAPYVYEFISLSIPLIKSYDCQADKNPPCDFTMLDYLENGDEEDAPVNNPFIDALKDLKDNKN